MTAGNLVFYGSLEGYINAFDAYSGRYLWRFKTSSGIVGNVNTYMQDGKQYISVLSGMVKFGANMPNSLNIDKNTVDLEDGLGASYGAFHPLSDWTRLGGVLSVFTLPDNPLK